MEIWKPIPGFSGSYEASTLGRIRSLDRRCTRGRAIKGRILTPAVSRNGYLRLLLYKGGSRRTYSVHRLIAKTFCTGYVSGYTVNHIDFDKTNNHYTNLEWVSVAENNMHSLNKRRKGIVKALAKHYLVTFPCNTEKVVYNLNKFCREHDLNQGKMSLVVNGHRKHHKGFKCKLLENKL